jgi:hypothetical protein
MNFRIKGMEADEILDSIAEISKISQSDEKQAKIDKLLENDEVRISASFC